MKEAINVQRLQNILTIKKIGCYFLIETKNLGKNYQKLLCIETSCATNLHSRRTLCCWSIINNAPQTVPQSPIVVNVVLVPDGFHMCPTHVLS
jgi:hypothetical protein